MKKITYHKSVTFKDEKGRPHSIQSQQYQVGVYVIINNDPAMQFNMTPQQMLKAEKSFKKDFEAGIITELEFGPTVTVTDDDGLWKIIEET